MANDGRFLTLENGLPKQERAVNTSAGAGDADKIPRLDAAGRISSTMMPAGIGAETITRPASEALAAGDLVNIWNDAGTSRVRRADASAAGKPAHGFVLAGVANSATATIYLEGTITGLTGLTAGANQFLSPTTPGARTETAPTAANQVNQLVGYALSATEMTFEADTPITLA